MLGTLVYGKGVKIQNGLQKSTFSDTLMENIDGIPRKTITNVPSNYL